MDEVTGRVWPFLASALGAAYTHLGRVSEALPLLEEAVERAVAIKLKANHSLRLARLAEAHVRAGRTEAAFPLAAQALDLAQSTASAATRRTLSGSSRRSRLRARRPPSTGPRKTTGRPSLWPRSRHATTPGALPPRPRPPVCQRVDREAAATAAAAARELYRAMDMTFW